MNAVMQWWWRTVQTECELDPKIMPIREAINQIAASYKNDSHCKYESDQEDALRAITGKLRGPKLRTLS